LDAKWSQNRVGQGHKSKAGDSTTDLTRNSRTDSADNRRLGIDKTDRELGFSDDILDNTLDDILDFTGPTVESTGRTDCTKPIDVQKCYMSNREGLQHTTFSQLSALLTMQPTSDSQEMPQETLPSQTMSTMFYMPMPLLGTLGSPMFEGANVTEFLKRYDNLCSDYWVSEKDRLMRLPRYYI